MRSSRCHHSSSRLTPPSRITHASCARWRALLLPLSRSALAAVAISAFVPAWNDFLWPSLMLHTRANMTLPVGLAALQGVFSSDFRATAAGVTMTVIPILIFFVLVQRVFVRGLSGAVKG